MVAVVFVHGVGGPSTDDRWLKPLNRRLAELGFPSLSASVDDIRAPDYSSLFDVAEWAEPPVSNVRLDERALARHKLEYTKKQKALERRVRPMAERSDVFGFNVAPDLLRDPIAEVLEFFAFERVTRYVERAAVRHAIWSRILQELPTREPVIIIAHSLGTVAVAGLLRRLPPNISVELLVTVGSPLYFDRYRSHSSSLSSNFPYSRVKSWLNVYSPWDGVTGGKGIAKKLPQAFDVCVHIDGSHDLDAYMSHPAVAMAVGSTVFASGSPSKEPPNGLVRRIHDSWLELLLGTAFAAQVSRDMPSDKWRARQRLDGAREEVARRTVADIEEQRATRIRMLAAAREAGVQFTQAQADDHPCADGRYPTYYDLTAGASPLLRSRWSDEELLAFGVALLVQPIVAPFDISVELEPRTRALELTLDRVRRDGSDLADRTFAEQVASSLRWAERWMSDGKFPWGAVLIGSGIALLAATGVGLVVAAPAGLAGAAVVTSTLAAFGPGGMVGGLLTLSTLTGTAASLTTLGVASESEDHDVRSNQRSASAAGADLAAATPQSLTVSLASMLAVIHAQQALGFESTEETARIVLANALDTAVSEHRVHAEFAPDREGTKAWLRKVELIEKALRGLDDLCKTSDSGQRFIEARRSLEEGKPSTWPSEKRSTRWIDRRHPH